VGNRLAYGDVVVQLEAAALAIGRPDAALSGHPLLTAWTFWSQLDTARRYAEVDGRRVDLYRLATFGFLYSKVRKATWPCSESAEIRRLRGFSFRHSSLRFHDDFWRWNADRIPELLIGEVVLPEQIDVPP
jgi:hypothetical protein